MHELYQRHHLLPHSTRPRGGIWPRMCPLSVRREKNAGHNQACVCPPIESIISESRFSPYPTPLGTCFEETSKASHHVDGRECSRPRGCNYYKRSVCLGHATKNAQRCGLIFTRRPCVLALKKPRKPVISTNRSGCTSFIRGAIFFLTLPGLVAASGR